MIRLAVIGDVHHHLRRLAMVLERARALNVDGILQVGDIGSPKLGRRPGDPRRLAHYQVSVDQVLDLCNAVAPTLWVPGNHDLRHVAGAGNVDGTVGTLAGLRVAGIGGAGPTRFGFPYEWDEDDVRAMVVPDCEVLLVHAPPRDTPLDWVPRSRVHVGSAAIRERALAHVGAMVCGHIHESAGVAVLGECVALNAGGLGEPWGGARIGVLEWDDGVSAAWVEDLDAGIRVGQWRRDPGPAPRAG